MCVKESKTEEEEEKTHKFIDFILSQFGVLTLYRFNSNFFKIYFQYFLSFSVFLCHAYFFIVAVAALLMQLPTNFTCVIIDFDMNIKWLKTWKKVCQNMCLCVQLYINMYVRM